MTARSPSETLSSLFGEVISLRDSLCEFAVFEQMPSFFIEYTGAVRIDPLPVVRIGNMPVDVPQFNNFCDVIEYAKNIDPQLGNRMYLINEYFRTFEGLTVLQKTLPSVVAAIIGGATSLLLMGGETEKKEYIFNDSQTHVTPCAIDLASNVRGVKLIFDIPDNVSKSFTGLDNPQYFIRGQLYATFEVQGAYVPQIELTYSNMFLEVPNSATRLIISTLPLKLNVGVMLYV